MRWRGGRRSSNVEDQRGMSGGLGGGMRFPGGGMRFPGGGGIPGGRKTGLGGFGLIAVIVIALLLGFDPSQLLQDGSSDRSAYVPEGPTGAAEEELKEFVSVVLADTEDTWHEQFRTLGRTYEEPRLVLFSNAVGSACGYAQSAMGPFYCPGDRKVYLDLSFFDELAQRFQAPGDFAGAYVVAHEVGHHVQNIRGTMDKVNQERSRMSEVDANALSVRVELQADCFAGVWANNAHRAATSSKPATWRKASPPPRRSATIACSARARATSCQIPSPTAARSSASGGSGAAWPAATSPTATRSTPASCDRITTSPVNLLL